MPEPYDAPCNIILVSLIFLRPSLMMQCQLKNADPWNRNRLPCLAFSRAKVDSLAELSVHNLNWYSVAITLWDLDQNIPVPIPLWDWNIRAFKLWNPLAYSSAKSGIFLGKKVEYSVLKHDALKLEYSRPKVEWVIPLADWNQLIRCVTIE